MKHLISITLFLFSLNTFAVTSCPGKVTKVMDWPSKCDGNLAFRLDSTGDIWFCALSNTSNSMILTAYTTGKTVVPRIDTDIAPDCESLSHYHRPRYIITD